MPAFKSHHTSTVDTSWDAGKTNKNVKSGEERAYYGRVYAWYDPEGEEGVKSTYKFPHHEVSADGTPGPANLTACSAGIAVLNGGRGGADVPDSDRSAIHAHLATHLKDGKKDVPPLEGGREGVGYPLLSASLYGKCWALDPAKLTEIITFADAVLSGQKPGAGEYLSGRSGLRGSETYRVSDGVATIPIYGVLDKRMNLLTNTSGGTSYELLVFQIQQAAADPNVEGILLDVDSPGGSTDGVQIAGDVIYRTRSQKPIVAYANGQMTSAAYWLGSAAHRVIAPEMALTGSIGVRLVHEDRSEADAKAGIKRTTIYSGRYKNFASGSEPLSAGDREYLQRATDKYYDIFVNDVARNRGVTEEVAQEIMADGRLFFTGATAKAAGLIDEIGTYTDALAAVKNMAREGGKGASDMSLNLATLKSQHPELYAEALAVGAAESRDAVMATARAEGVEEGIKTERVRVVEILEAAGLQGLAFKAINDGLEVKTALKQFLAHQDQIRADVAASLAGAAPPSVGSDPVKVETFTAKPATKAVCQQLGISQEDFKAEKERLAKGGN